MLQTISSVLDQLQKRKKTIWKALITGRGDIGCTDDIFTKVLSELTVT